MTNFNALGLVFGIALPSLFMWFYADGLMLKRIDAIASGIVRGVPVSVQHRRLMLYYSWGMVVLAGLGYMLLLTFAWMMIAEKMVDPRLQSFCYLLAFFALIGFIAWLVQSFFWYFHLASMLRQAEAD